MILPRRFSASIVPCLLLGLAGFCLSPVPTASAAPGPGALRPTAIKAKAATTADDVILKAGSHVIVLEPDASASEVHAAQELQAYFLVCFGAELPLVNDPAQADRAMIVLGTGEAARSLGVDPTTSSLGEQGYVMRTVGPDIVIAGTPEAGTLYGVHRFLEEFLGVRWYAPGVTVRPEKGQVTIPALDRLVKPAFLFRNIYYTWPGKDADFLAHMADNAGSGGANNPTGIQYQLDGTCHSYFWYLSPDEFFDTHPEYFSEIGGVRIRNETQLCLTNPDVLEIVTQRMLQRMAAYPNARQHNFSQMDWYNYCECDKCRAMNEQYGTTGGTQFWFVNQLAARTSLVYPDKLIGTLAYTFTEEPPVGMYMHPNVAVWLCHMYPSCDSHPVASCPLDANYKRRAERWAEIDSHLYIWHYIVNFSHYYEPFPNFGAMSEDMKLYRDLGVEGIFLQGMGQGGGGGEFSLLRGYYGAKLLWDPDQDPIALRRDFLKGYYSDAWKPIDDYVQMLQDKVDDENIHMHLYTNPAQGYLTDDIVKRAQGQFAQAARAVQDDPELLDRVQVAAMPVTYARLFPRNGYDLRQGWLSWLGDIASPEEAQEFVDLMDAHGFQNVMEFFSGNDILMLLDAIFSIHPAVRKLQNDMLTVDVVPLLAGRPLRITDNRTGQSITAYDVKQSLYFPFTGGLEDRVGDGATFFGWLEPAGVTDQSRSSITTTATTLDGYQLVRTLMLDPDDPILYVRTVLTNPFDEAREVRLRSHLELNLGDIYETRVQFVNQGGDYVDQDMTSVIDGLREGEHFYLDETPDGAWTFTGDKGLQVTQRFDTDDIEYTLLTAYPDNLDDLEVELWANHRVLQPGESMELYMSLEVRPGGN